MEKATGHCPLCGGAIVGRNAVEVLDEHKGMVSRAKAAEQLLDAAESFERSTWLDTLPDDDECCARWRFHWEREELAEFRAALADWRATRKNLRI